MSRSSPGVKRVAAILNFIAEHPGQAFALTDLVRALKLSRATCHALLTGLVEVGYLYRTSDKSYVLGPALAAIGRTAAQHFSPLQVAQPEMRRLADEFNVLCGAYFVEENMVHLRDRAASASHVGYPVPLGARFRLHESIAPIFFPDRETGLAAWQRTLDYEPGEESQELFLEVAEFIAEHGFIAIERLPGFVIDRADYDQDLASSMKDVPIKPVTDLTVDRSHGVVSIMAPIFDHRNQVSFALGMAGFVVSMPASKVVEAGNRLRETCDRISAYIAGRSSEVN